MRRTTTSAALLALLIAALLITVALSGACKDDEGGSHDGQTAEATPVSNAAALTLSTPPTRIVSLAPNLTEFLFALGVGDHVVGVTRFCDQPPAAAKLPKVGGFVDLDVETVLSLEPDLVVALEGTRKRGFLEPLEQAGIHVYWTALDSEADVYRVTRELGALVGRPDSAERVVASIREGLAAVERRVADAPLRRTLLVYGHEPLVVAGPGSFSDALIRRARGVNVAGDGRLPFPTWTIEEVVRAAPEVIIDGWVGGDERVDMWSRWESIPAVRDGRVHRMTDTAALRPGPRLPEALAAVARRIHPERFEPERDELDRDHDDGAPGTSP